MGIPFFNFYREKIIFIKEQMTICVWWRIDFFVYVYTKIKKPMEHFPLYNSSYIIWNKKKDKNKQNDF